DPEADPDTDPEADPDTDPEADPDTDPETDPDTDPDTDPEADPDPDSDLLRSFSPFGSRRGSRERSSALCLCGESPSPFLILFFLFLRPPLPRRGPTKKETGPKLSAPGPFLLVSFDGARSRSIVLT
ncbi:MAG: hypothetical protein AAF488_14180, partial [Planctomycetota bacterium]